MFRRFKIAFLSYHLNDGPVTIRDSLEYYKLHSEFSVHEYNLAELSAKGSFLKFPLEFDPLQYSAILIHNTASYYPSNLRSIIDSISCLVSNGHSVPPLFLFRQDENNNLREFRSLLNDIKIAHIFSCLPNSEQSIVYGNYILKTSSFSTIYTGYIHPRLLELDHPNFTNRSIDIGYRGSVQDLSFGKLAYEKFSIGYDVNRLLISSGLNLDISSDPDDRLGPDKWIDFLLNCKSTLGAESGSSIFDLDGLLDHKIDKAISNSPYKQDDPRYAKHVLNTISDYEDNVNYRQVSPRHFEAACCKTVQILFPGNYSGIFIRDKHYIELYRDFSNLSYVLNCLNDQEYCDTLTSNAYNDIAINPLYSLNQFCEIVDSAVIAYLQRSNLLPEYSTYSLPDSSLGQNCFGLNICAHPPHVDPRLDWISSFCPTSVSISQVGINRFSLKDHIKSAQYGFCAELSPKEFDYEFLDSLRNDLSFNGSALSHILLNYVYTMLSSLDFSSSDFCKHYSVANDSEGVLRAYIRYLLDNCSTLFGFLRRVDNISFIIASDLDTLLPALFAKAVYQIPIIYDAHEYWPESNPSNTKSITQFWSSYEHLLVPYCDICQTVSQGLANFMEHQYSTKFFVLPNATPLNEDFVINSPRSKFSATSNSSSAIRFLYQGGFAPHRGLDLLIKNWKGLNINAKLYFRGPDSGDYRAYLVKLAKDLDLHNISVFFLPSVSEDDLVDSACQSADIAIIPYTPSGVNYKYCSPNKLSQYMAAGLPILSNYVSFMPELLEKNDIGWSVDFSNKKLFQTCIINICSDISAIEAKGFASQAYFRQCYNWQALSKEFYLHLSDLSDGKSLSANSVKVYSFLKKTCQISSSNYIAGSNLTSWSTRNKLFRRLSKTYFSHFVLFLKLKTPTTLKVYIRYLLTACKRLKSSIF